MINFYILETFMQIKFKQKSKIIKNRKKLQMMHEIISILNCQTARSLRGDSGTACQV